MPMDGRFDVLRNIINLYKIYLKFNKNPQNHSQKNLLEKVKDIVQIQQSSRKFFIVAKMKLRFWFSQNFKKILTHVNHDCSLATIWQLMFSSHTGFPTNRTELNAVFDIFDKSNRNYIEYKDFIEALKPARHVSTPSLSPGLAY